MPIITVQTNLPGVPNDFPSSLASLVSEAFNKPKERISIIVETGKRMEKNGSAAPLAIVHMECLAVFDDLSEEKNAEYSQKILNFFNEALQLSDDRITVVFVPLKLNLVAKRS